MSYKIFFLLLFLCIPIILLNFLNRDKQANTPLLAEEFLNVNISDTVEAFSMPVIEEIDPLDIPLSEVKAELPFTAPISDSVLRVTKKPFGIHITPESSPVKFDIFNGYHTGVDFEVFDHEIDIPVPILTICSGPLMYKGWVKGYGGVAIQACILHKKPVTIVYGHLQLASVIPNKGDYLERGEVIGILGQGYSQETDGRRKHLHLGIHQGKEINFRGYTDKKINLESWIDILNHMYVGN